MVTALLMGSPGYADTTTATPDSVPVTTGEIVTPTTGVATKGVAVNAHGVPINVPKVSDPVLRVRASSTTTVPRISVTTLPAWAGACSVADNPEAGQLNRLIEVTVAPGESGNVYGELTYSTTDVTNNETTRHSVEPFGANGLNVSPPAGTTPPPTVVSVTICVA